MLAAQRLDENPCRPRHFRPPPPCEPVVADARQAALLETCRNRLVATAGLFTLVFLLICLRLVGNDRARFVTNLARELGAAGLGERRHWPGQTHGQGDGKEGATDRRGAHAASWGLGGVYVYFTL